MAADTAADPSVLTALSAELRRLERLPAAREPLSPEQAARLFGAIAEAREALVRLADVVQRGEKDA